MFYKIDTQNKVLTTLNFVVKIIKFYKIHTQNKVLRTLNFVVRNNQTAKSTQLRLPVSLTHFRGTELTNPSEYMSESRVMFKPDTSQVKVTGPF